METNRRVASFSKVSRRAWSVLRDVTGEEYDNIKIPRRASIASAGYDFYSPVHVVLRRNDTAVIPTGIRCKMSSSTVLNIYPRSSLGIKKSMRLLNTVGIIDSDYYYSDNEGHIFIAVKNEGENDLEINIGDRFAQGVFMQYGITEEDDTVEQRNGGIGSSGN